MGDKVQWFKDVKFTRDDCSGYYRNSTKGEIINESKKSKENTEKSSCV